MDRIPIYLVPGLAASIAIFEHLELPEDRFEMHYLDWLIPKSESEPIGEYARRMCERITHKNPILIGVSFGGVVVQEMSKVIEVQKVIIISSVKTKNELPKRLQLAKTTKAYKLFPTTAILNFESFAKYAFGTVAKKRVELYRKYLSMRDKTYLPWAVYNILHWNQETVLPNVVHIHGDADGVFPVKCIKDSIIIEGGTHVMILNKAKKISSLLVEVI